MLIMPFGTCSRELRNRWTCILWHCNKLPTITNAPCARITHGCAAARAALCAQGAQRKIMHKIAIIFFIAPGKRQTMLATKWHDVTVYAEQFNVASHAHTWIHFSPAFYLQRARSPMRHVQNSTKLMTLLELSLKALLIPLLRNAELVCVEHSAFCESEVTLVAVNLCN